jgi:hypothetical protein
VDGAVLVWCSPLPWLSPVLMTPLCVGGGASGFLRPSAPVHPCTGSGAGWGSVPEVPLEQRPVPATA